MKQQLIDTLTAYFQTHPEVEFIELSDTPTNRFEMAPRVPYDGAFAVDLRPDGILVFDVDWDTVENEYTKPYEDCTEQELTKACQALQEAQAIHSQAIN